MFIDSNALLENVTETEQEPYAEVKVPELLLEAEPPSIAASATSEDCRNNLRVQCAPLHSPAQATSSDTRRFA